MSDHPVVVISDEENQESVQETQNEPAVPPSNYRQPHRNTTRRYCFTLFLEEESIKERWTRLPPTVKYLVYQAERCPETHRLHLQGYLLII